MKKLTSFCGLLLLTACGSPSSVLHDAPADVRADVVGRYAMVLTFASSQKLPIVGQVNTLGRLYKLADIQSSGSGLTITERNCRLSFDGGAKLSLTFGDASIQTSPPMEGRFEVTVDPTGTTRFKREMLTQVVGATLADPYLDPLPLSLKDPRLVDMDGDGKPAMTSEARVFVLRSSMHYVLRTTHAYSGTLTQPGIFQGLVKDRTDGSILDVAHLLLRPAIGRFELTPDPDASKSTAVLVKIEDGLDCADVLSTDFTERTGMPADPSSQPQSTSVASPD